MVMKKIKTSNNLRQKFCGNTSMSVVKVNVLKGFKNQKQYVESIHYLYFRKFTVFPLTFFHANVLHI